MGQSIMRGRLADAIRATHQVDVARELKAYQKENVPSYLRARALKQLKDAERLAENVLKRNQMILEAIVRARAELKGD